jgi:hypothetical protein
VHLLDVDPVLPFSLSGLGIALPLGGIAIMPWVFQLMGDDWKNHPR